MHFGLCQSCSHSLKIRHPRGHIDYLKCRHSGKPRYPVLPVHLCDGYQKVKGLADAPV